MIAFLREKGLTEQDILDCIHDKFVGLLKIIIGKEKCYGINDIDPHLERQDMVHVSDYFDLQSC